RRARADAVPAQAAAEPAAPRVRERTPEEAAAALGALQSGTAAARSALETEGNDPR
ncbi:ATP-binding protein, partial [Streptomyces sp. SID13588]|nr:ATP-binding protein [Streptomyces sp. SID13588]